MTENDLSIYQALCVYSYQAFCVALIDKSKYTLEDISNEFDWDLWKLSEVFKIIVNYIYDSDHNAYTDEEMNQWRDIFNDIANTNHYFDFTK